MKTKILYIIIPVVFIIAMNTACTEKIDIELDETYTRLVVDGKITTDTGIHYVKLSMTTSYFYNQPSPKVSGAIVRIWDGYDTIQLEENPSIPGLYQTLPDFYGVVGRLYTLDIELENELNGNKKYTASSFIQPINQIDSIKVEYKPQWEAWAVNCYALDPETTEFYMFNLYRNNNLVTDTLNELFVVDDRLYNGNYTNGISVGFFQEEYPDEILVAGDTVTLEMGSITEDFAYFIWDVQIETGYNIPLFSGPPANIKGNISGGALGFFACYSVARSSVIYQPEEEQ